MLKTRIISAVIGMLLLIAVVLAGSSAFTIFIFLLSAIGIHEFYKAIEKGGYKPVRPIGYISCIFILAAGFNGGLIDIDVKSALIYIFLSVFIILASLLAVIVFRHEQHQIADIALTLMGIVYVVFLFSFVVLSRNLPYGLWLIWFVFIGAFATDTFAYFAGVNFGKRKILPQVSPKKSLEGMIGGIAGCVAVTLIYGTYLANRGVLDVAIHKFIILGLLNGVISQVGDWSASAIKRYMGVKDYGTIMPGHGGVLDRFDSILFVAPVVYFYFVLILL